MARQFEQRGRRPREPKEFEERVLDIARVTRVTKGGKRMRFRASLVIGDRKGRVGFGIGKAIDVPLSVGKAVRAARKAMIRVPLIDDTISHAVQMKFAAAKILLKPAPQGTGVKAGGAMRVVLELAGVPNVVGKQLGSANKINNAKAVMMALSSLEQAASRLPKSSSNKKKDQAQAKEVSQDKAI